MYKFPRMIIAGVDEAGYGPLLGPLVVGCCAFRVDETKGDEMPCLWQRLRRAVGKTKSTAGGGRKLHINDSKLVYSPSQGVKELERGVLTIATTLHSAIQSLDALLEFTASHALSDLSDYAWYRAAADETFPITHDPISIRIQANALAMEMQKTKTACVHLAARVVCERQFNAMLAATRNKASTLFSISAIHLDHLLRTHGHEDLTIVCDLQGARQHYGSLLRLMFDEWALEVVEESDAQSAYRLRRDGHLVKLYFWQKAESQCLPVAVASMLGKYLREALMRRFNSYWLGHLPTLSPTAGYYTDGLRFLRDIEIKRKELGIADGQLIRCR